MTATLADLFRAVGHSAQTLAEAIEEDDSILGTMASSAFLICIAQLPAELRADMVVALTEES